MITQYNYWSVISLGKMRVCYYDLDEDQTKVYESNAVIQVILYAIVS